MKFNKWTVGLATVGVISLASAAKAEEKASSVMTALSGTTLSGYVDTSMEWNPGTGNTYVPPYKFNSPSKADGFNLDVVQLRVDKPLDEAEWAAGYRVDMWMGPDANTLGTQSIWGNPTSSAASGDFALRQAYVALRTPVGNGLDWKMGVFDSVVGYESVESPNDPNYTRSYGHSIEPQTHTGVLASYRFSDAVSASAGIANTVGPRINSRANTPVQQAYPGTVNSNPYAESYKTYMASVALTAPESMGFLTGSTLYAGVVNGFNNSTVGTGYAAPSLNVYAGATIATPVTGLRFGVAWDWLKTDSYPDPSAVKVEADMWAIGLYASYQATEKLSLHLRGEYITGNVDSPAGVDRATIAALLGSGNLAGDVLENGLYEVTATVQYDLWKNVLSRLEFRWDHSEHTLAFGGQNTTTAALLGNRYNYFMLAANVIYKF